MSILDQQEPHVVIKANRVRELYKIALNMAEMDRDIALLYLAGFLVQARDFVIDKTGMHPNTCEQQLEKYADDKGYTLATTLLVEDYKRYREVVRAQHIGSERQPDSPGIVLAPG